MISRTARLIAAPVALVALGLSATTLSTTKPAALSLLDPPVQQDIQEIITAQNATPAEDAESSTATGRGYTVVKADSGAGKTGKTDRLSGDEAVKPKKPPLPIPRSFDEWAWSGSRILIDQANRLLYYKTRKGKIESAPIAVGRDGHFTPIGQFHVQQVRKNPSWYPTPSMKREAIDNGEYLPDSVPPGPHNPLGKYFIRFQPEYGIHGTNEPRSIGEAISRGCVRMHNIDVIQLAKHVKVGDGITIVKGFDFRPVEPAVAYPDFVYEPYSGSTATRFDDMPLTPNYNILNAYGG